MKLDKILLIGAGAFVAHKLGLFDLSFILGPADTSAVSGSQRQRVVNLPEGSFELEVVDTGLIIGGSPAQQVIDPETGQIIATDPQGAIATGGGIFRDPQGFVRFGTGGFVKTTAPGEGISGTELPGGGIAGIGIAGGEIIPASFEDPAVLEAKAAQAKAAAIANKANFDAIISGSIWRKFGQGSLDTASFVG